MPPKKNSDPNRPKGRTSAYAYFVAHARGEYKKEGKRVDFAAFSRECSRKWKNMDDDKKEEFVKDADLDKQRYEEEMKRYVRPAASESGRRSRKKKDPNAPKRPLSAFIFFCQEKRPKVKEENPGYSIGEIAKVLGGMWQELKQKEPYQEMARQDRKRYEDQKESYVPQDVDDDEEEEEDEDED